MKVTMTGAKTKTAYRTEDGSIKRYPARVCAFSRSDFVRAKACIIVRRLHRRELSADYTDYADFALTLNGAGKIKTL
jgi:hypothetical protein